MEWSQGSNLWGSDGATAGMDEAVAHVFRAVILYFLGQFGNYLHSKSSSVTDHEANCLTPPRISQPLSLGTYLR